MDVEGKGEGCQARTFGLRMDASRKFEAPIGLRAGEFDTVEYKSRGVSCELEVVASSLGTHEYECLAANEGGHSHSQLTVCVYGR